MRVQRLFWAGLQPGNYPKSLQALLEEFFSQL